MRTAGPGTLNQNPHLLRLARGASLLALGLTLTIPLPAQAAGARLILPDLVLAGFTNGQDRVRVIVNLVPPARALQPTDWNSAAVAADPARGQPGRRRGGPEFPRSR